MPELLRVRAAAQQRNQRVMGVHPNILSSGQKSPAQNSEHAQNREHAQTNEHAQTSRPAGNKKGGNSNPAQNS